MRLVYLTLEAAREGQASYVHIHEIIKGLKKLGVEVTLSQPDYTHKPVSPPLIMRLFHVLMLQVRLWWHWPRGQNAVLYLRAHYMAFPSALIAWLFKIPIVQEINGPYEDVFVTYPSLKPVRPLLIPLLRWQYKRATGLITVTQDLVDWVNTQSDRQDCAFISNGANTDLFHPNVPAAPDLPDEYVVFFGGLTRWHGVPVMLEAAAHEEWPQNVKLVIIGDGQESLKVREAANQYSHIIALGAQKYTDMPSYIGSALAGIVMISDPGKRSSTGVFPLKLFEILSCGIPAIVSDLPGQADLVREADCGYVLPIDDAPALANCVKYIFQNKEDVRRKGQAGHILITKHHSWKVRADQTYDYIQSIL